MTGSARVQRALDDFVKNSSDARTKLEAELERAAGLLSGLAHGATALDRWLGETVPVNAPFRWFSERSARCPREHADLERAG